MNIRYTEFGCIEVDKHEYRHDIVIKKGHVHKRKKDPSKAYKQENWHTPITAFEHIPWGQEGGSLIIGTGQSGLMPIHDSIYDEAEERGVHLEIMRTEDACIKISDMDPSKVFAVLHVTC